MTSKPPKIGIVFAGTSDYEVVRPAADLIESWDIGYEICSISPARDPHRVVAWATGAEARGLEVIIAAGGRAAHLPAAIAAHTLLPVIGIPISDSSLNGEDALYSMVQSPLGTPIATVGIEHAQNAALLALQILARIEPAARRALESFRATLPERESKYNEKLRLDRPNASWDFIYEIRSDGPTTQAEKPQIEPVRPADKSAPPEGPRRRPSPDDFPRMEPQPQAIAPRPLPDWEARHAEIRAKKAEHSDTSGEPTYSPPIYAPGTSSAEYGKLPGEEPLAAPPMESEKVMPAPRKRGRIPVDHDLMPFELVSDVIDCLREGGIVAIPTDTVYGLIVDATNEDAVQRVYVLKNRPPQRATAVFVDSMRMLQTLIEGYSQEIRGPLEAFWPGPLTVVLKKRAGVLDHMSSGDTIGVREPDHSIPLTLIQELGKPLACTSANPSGLPEAQSADQVQEYFGNRIEMILDAGKLTPMRPSTVLDMTGTPYKILREGAISRDKLAAVVGDLIQEG